MWWRDVAQGEPERGAIAMMFAILIGTGALLVIAALAVDGGQMYFRNRQVQVAADAAVESLAYECMRNTVNCANVDSATAWVRSSIEANGAIVRGAGLGVCLHLTAGGTCLTPTLPNTSPDLARCKPLTLPDGTVVSTTGARQYVRVVVQATASNAYRPLLSDGAARQYIACGQASWTRATVSTYQVPNPFITSACNYNANGSTFVTLIEDPSNGGGAGSQTPVSCTANWGDTYTSTTFGSALTGISGLATTGTTCTAMITLGLNTDTVTGRTIQDVCPNIATNIETWYKGTGSSPTFPYYLPLSGNLVRPKSTWEINIVGFARFDLYGYNPASSKDWTMRSGTASPGGCDSPPKLVCLYGKWVPSSLIFTGNTTVTSNVWVLQ